MLFIKRSIRKYQAYYEDLLDKLQKDFDYQAPWIIDEVVKTKFILNAYLLCEEEGGVDFIYKMCESHVLSAHNSKPRSTSVASNFVEAQRYTARLIFMEEVKPYLTENK